MKLGCTFPLLPSKLLSKKLPERALSRADQDPAGWATFGGNRIQGN